MGGEAEPGKSGSKDESDTYVLVLILDFITYVDLRASHPIIFVHAVRHGKLRPYRWLACRVAVRASGSVLRHVAPPLRWASPLAI